MKVDLNTPIIIIYGATGTGKTEFAEQIAQKTNGAIINMDMGQLYTKLSIGTAKPNWKESNINQYLFDTIDEERHFSAVEYRKRVEELVQKLLREKKTIIIVGGTGFYLYNLIFSSQIKMIDHRDSSLNYPQDWNHLNDIDPERAAQIHPNDTYRIKRALEIFYKTKTLPSKNKPLYDPVHSHILIINIERDKHELKKRIEERINSFFADGWLEEVRGLIRDNWTNFLLEKKFIGYSTLIKMIQEKDSDIERAKREIFQATMSYAKRQKTFWRGLSKKISASLFEQKNITLVEANLTFTQLDLYLNLFLKKFFPHA